MSYLQGNTSKIWTKLVGSPNEFRPGSRVVNAVLIITAAILLPTTLTNILAKLIAPFYINCVLLVSVGTLYYFSRVRSLSYKVSLVIYAICSYVTLIVLFIYNSGSNGPNIFLFFLTFQLLIAISPKKQVVLWVVMHSILGFVLMFLELKTPSLVKSVYETDASRFFDNAVTYIICLFFIYLITIYLRNKYEKEKVVAQQRAEQIKLKVEEAGRRNEQLKKIALIQSHQVRNHVSTILGLAELLDSDSSNIEDNKTALNGIKSTARHLDEVIREINDLTNYGVSEIPKDNDYPG